MIEQEESFESFKKKLDREPKEKARKETEEKKSARIKSFSKGLERIEKAIPSVGISLGGKILKKPSVSIQKYSAVKAIKGMADRSEGLVREVPERVYANDNRSLFFNKEMIRDKRWMEKD